MAETLGRKWESFRESVIPADAGKVQLQESRRAFYAGAWAFFTLISSDEVTSKSEDDGAAFLEELRKELLAFAAAVSRGQQ